MAQDNEYVQKLIAVRDREVKHRRDVAEALAEKHSRGDTENMREAFIKIQDVIEAIERAVWHRDISPTQSPSHSRLWLQKLIQRINRQRTNRKVAGVAAALTPLSLPSRLLHPKNDPQTRFCRTTGHGWALDCFIDETLTHRSTPSH